MNVVIDYDRMEREQRCAVAHHEASHAVVLAHFGCPVREIHLLSVAKTREWMGNVSADECENLNRETQAIVCLAGPLGESRFRAALHASKYFGGTMEESLSSVSFDDSDDLTRFVPEVTQDIECRRSGACPLRFKRDHDDGFSPEQEVDGFLGDVDKASNLKGTGELLPLLVTARRVLQRQPVWNAVVELARALLARQPTVQEVSALLDHRTLAQLLRSFRAQPDREITVLEMPGDCVRRIVVSAMGKVQPHDVMNA